MTRCPGGAANMEGDHEQHGLADAHRPPQLAAVLLLEPPVDHLVGQSVAARHAEGAGGCSRLRLARAALAACMQPTSQVKLWVGFASLPWPEYEDSTLLPAPDGGVRYKQTTGPWKDRRQRGGTSAAELARQPGCVEPPGVLHLARVHLRRRQLQLSQNSASELAVRQRLPCRLLAAALEPDQTPSTMLGWQVAPSIAV